MLAALTFLLCFTSAAAGDADLVYLESKKSEAGVIALPSGLMYKVMRGGTGAYHPTADSSCSCNYEGKLIDGTKFDSSYDRGEPTSFAPNQVIKGWVSVFACMPAPVCCGSGCA